jgi:hypothetical protein
MKPNYRNESSKMYLTFIQLKQHTHKVSWGKSVIYYYNAAYIYKIKVKTTNAVKVEKIKAIRFT